MLRDFHAIPARTVTVTSVKNRFREITGWKFQCFTCNLDTTYPPESYDDAIEFRITHRCFSKHNPNKRVTIQRASSIHSSSEGTGRA